MFGISERAPRERKGPPRLKSPGEALIRPFEAADERGCPHRSKGEAQNPPHPRGDQNERPDKGGEKTTGETAAGTA